MTIRLASLASLLMLAVTVALTLITVQREQATFRADTEAEADLLLDTLIRTTRDQLYRRDIDELDEITDIVANDETVLQVSIFDERGFLLAQSDLPSPVLAAEADSLGAMLVEREGDTPYLSWEAGQLVAGRPLIIGSRAYGAIALTVSTAPLEQQIQQTTTQAVLIAAVAIVIAIVLNFLAARRITGPLRQLTYAANLMSAGDLSVRVSPSSKDEVGQLSRTFDEMAASIQRRETELRELNESLEQQVQARTAELRQQNEELIVARQRAEEATQLKSQFLANISHELRTPLNAIMGYTQLMLMGIPVELPAVQKEQVQRIMKSSETLLGLINNLLDLAKIEAGRTELVNKSFHLREWIAATTRPLEVLAHEKQIEFAVSVDDHLPAVIVSDAERLRQIVVNLVSNAVKFTDQGSVTVWLEKLSGEPPRWSISIQDTGIGIPSHAQDFIFEEFRQADGTTTRQHGGTGLGLAIARNLARIMNGVIRVKSKVGEGSTFTVELPLVVAEVADARPPVI